MPYIEKNRRQALDKNISDLKGTLQGSKEMTPENLLDIAGDINYCVTRLVAGLVGTPSYKKIAIVTGVLQNINQEFYRRLAVPYEEEKMNSNGDIEEYK
jgi:hypothetical protein